MAHTSKNRLLLRRHWRLPALLVVLVAGLLVFGSGYRVKPIVTAGQGLPPRQPIQNITNSVDLFDPNVVHSISVSIEDKDRERMFTAYRGAGEKVVVPADVMIDGVTILALESGSKETRHCGVLKKAGHKAQAA